MRHDEPHLKIGGPPSKPKYMNTTDSELVPVSYTHLDVYKRQDLRVYNFDKMGSIHWYVDRNKRHWTV